MEGLDLVGWYLWYHLDLELDTLSEKKLLVISNSLFLGILIFEVTLAPVPEKIETSVFISNTNNISCCAYVSNWLILVVILVLFYFLVDYLVVLPISALDKYVIFFIINQEYKELIFFHLLTFNIHLMKFLYNSGLFVLEFPLNHSWSISNQRFDLVNLP